MNQNLTTQPLTKTLRRASTIEDDMRSSSEVRDLSLPEWGRTVFREFRETILSPGFPCYFAPKAFKAGMLLFGFAEANSDLRTMDHIAACVREYLNLIRGLSDEEAVLTVLVIFIKPGDSPSTLQEYQRQAWDILQYLYDHDSSSWPTDVPEDPDDQRWSFCFDGVPIFVNINAPAHQNRRSRNLGSALTLVVQPREAFDHIAGHTPKGDHIRKVIRDRIASYDTVGPAPDLATYGDPDCREWKQYGLNDDNGPSPSICPLRIQEGSTKHD